MYKKLLNEKLAKIMLSILKKINLNTDIKNKLINFLISEGLNEDEILETLEKISNQEELIDKSIKFRILSPLEVENLTDEALNYLLELKSRNRINEEIFEEILADISKIFVTIDLVTLKELIEAREVDRKFIIN